LVLALLVEPEVVHMHRALKVQIVSLVPSHLLEVAAVALTNRTQLPVVLEGAENHNFKTALLEQPTKVIEAVTKLVGNILELVVAVLALRELTLVRLVARQVARGLHPQLPDHL
jgi:hypothetical protein